jgi:hypothetical protein
MMKLTESISKAVINEQRIPSFEAASRVATPSFIEVGKTTSDLWKNPGKKCKWFEVYGLILGLVHYFKIKK